MRLCYLYFCCGAVEVVVNGNLRLLMLMVTVDAAILAHFVLR